jgi:Flp pilus assembly protein TadD
VRLDPVNAGRASQALLLVCLAACSGSESPDSAEAVATYVGSSACVACHEAEAAAWRGSHHDLAMDTATDQTVLGDFADVEFTFAGVTSRFFRRDGAFVVRTDGPDGALADYEVVYTFGVDPLQQYLVSFPGGRLQALSLAWDARPEAEGGQRWFHLIPDDTPAAGDELHWTGRTMNWNSMCAECHSTNVSKGYDAETHRYRTTFSEIDVSCESCHGPASEHIEVGAAWPEDAMAEPPGAWVIAEGESIAHRSEPLPNDAQVETCAHCHARRAMISEGRRAGEPLHDSDLVSRLDEGLYYADGQIRDEVYVYGSFAQSRMYTAGVRCADCHDPHTLELRQPGNAVCAQCHLPSTYDTPAHHNHTTGSSGAECAECHMPATTYMVVDPRRDHSMRIPRPHLSSELGTPNACSACHSDQPAEWAIEAVEEWYGPPDEEDEARVRAARAIHAGRTRAPGAGDALLAVASDPSESGITRATALALSSAYPSQATLEVMETSATDPDPMVRLGALSAVEGLPPENRLTVAFPLLRDSIRAVRVEAARVLAPVQPGALTDAQQALLWDGADEYIAAQLVNADHPGARINLGNFYAQRGMPADAESSYREALALDSAYLPGYVNLADLYRAVGRDRDGELLLERALTRAPRDPTLLHARGLLLVRMNRLGDALVDLESATRMAPDVPRYAYVYAVALNSAGEPDRAVQLVYQALERQPFDRDLLSLGISLHRDQGDFGRARDLARRLLEVAPNDPAILRMIGELGN